MYRLLIVDDEELERQAFCKILQQEMPLIEVVGEASSGRQAIELVQALRPDIITMDIKMPGINGLEALSEINQHFSEIKVIMLTAYDYFSYAQQSVNLGSFAYLLKPVKRDEIMEVMEKVIHAIESDRKKNKHQLETKEKLNSLLPHVEAEMCLHLIAGTHDAPSISVYSELLDFPIRSGYFMAVNLEADTGNEWRAYLDGTKTPKEELYNVVRDALKDTNPCIVSHFSSNVIAAFVSIEEGLRFDTIKSNSITAARKIQDKISKRIGLQARIGIGMPSHSVEEFQASYHHALFCIMHSQGTPETLLHYDDAKDNLHLNNNEYPIEKERIFLGKIITGDDENISRQFQSVLADIGRVCHCQPEELKFYLIKLAASISHVEYDYLRKNSFFDTIRCMILTDSKEMDRIKNILDEGIKRVAHEIRESRSGQDGSIASKACEFINKSFFKEITLEDVAKEVSVSPSYFSKIFKNNTGLNFIEYLTKVRLDQAKRLLVETNQSLKQIARNTGFNDPDYFCKVFKKATGLTPSEYRVMAETVKS